MCRAYCKMNFQSICRICIGENAGMVSIFEPYNFSTHNCEIFKVIKVCASVQIQKFDGFSEQICQTCLKHLSQAYSFKKLCEESDYKFRNGLIASSRMELKTEFSEEETEINYGDIHSDTKDNSDDEESKMSYAGLIDVKKEDFGDLPESVLSRAAKAVEAIVPQKSKSIYEKEYYRFIKWMEDNTVMTINETVMLGYFQELSETFSPNSLWTKLSMLRKELVVKKKIASVEKFVQLQEYLKQLTKSYKPKKSVKVLTREEVLKFLKEAPDETYLMEKVALLMGIFGACRRDELVKMRFTDVQDVGSYVTVDIRVTQNSRGRSFTVIEEEDMSALKLIRHYISLRPEGASNDRFFLCLRGNRCTSQPVGKNTFGSIPCRIAKYLGLADATDYTGHCLRRIAKLHSGAESSMKGLMQIGRLAHSSGDDSQCSKLKIARLVSEVETHTEVSTLKHEK